MSSEPSRALTPRALGSPRSPRSPRTPRSRTLLVSFLGAIVRRLGNWMPIAGAIDLLAPLGLDAPSVRTAVTRLKRRGWLVSELRGGVRGYALTSVALDALGAGDEVVWHARQPASMADGWCVVNFSVPESARSKRHRLRSHLASLGFGNIGTALWIAPARMRTPAEQAIAALGLEPYSAVFVGHHVSGQPLEDLLYRSWDLTGIDRGYREFIADYRGTAQALLASCVIAPREAFITYVDLVDRWRRLPFRDPGLPQELLAADWSGPAAGALFEHLSGALEGHALEYAATLWPPA